MQQVRFSMALVLALALTAVRAEASDFEFIQGRLFPAVTIASEHRFNGMSLTDRNPALQVSIHWWRPDNWFAGVWMTNVVFLDQNGTNYEFDTYVGRQFRSGEIEWVVQGLYSSFDDNEVGPSYDFFQASVEASREFDSLALGAALKYSPSASFGAGRAWQLDLEASHQVTDAFRLEVAAGRRLSERQSPRTHWRAGFVYEWRNVDVELAYTGLETGIPLCDFVDWCENAWVPRGTLASY